MLRDKGDWLLHSSINIQGIKKRLKTLHSKYAGRIKTIVMIVKGSALCFPMSPDLSSYHHRRLSNRDLKITCQNHFGAKFHSGEISHIPTDGLNIARCIRLNTVMYNSLQIKDNVLITNNICTVKLTEQVSFHFRWGHLFKVFSTQMVIS